MAAAANEVDDVIRDLKRVPGFNSYCVFNNDGIVIKYENMSYKDAVHHAHVVLAMYTKATRYIRDLFEAPDNDVESIRLRTAEYEMIVAQHGNFTFIATQNPTISGLKSAAAAAAVVATDAPKDGEEKKE